MMQDTILSEYVDTDQTLAELAVQWDTPVVAGLQHQGDISVTPADIVDDYRHPRELANIRAPREDHILRRKRTQADEIRVVRDRT